MVKKIIGKSYIYLILLLMYAPIFVLILFSFTNTENIGVWNGFSLKVYEKLFNDTEVLTALGNTILVAIVSSICSTVLGTLAAIGIFYSNRRAKKILEGFGQISIVNAEIVTAISLTLLFVIIAQVFKIDNIFGFATLIIGHVVLTVPFVILNVTPKLKQMDHNTYEAALDLGATPTQALWKVLLPEILPGILSGFLLCMTLSLDDYIITAFTRNNSFQTLSTYVEGVTKKGSLPNSLRALTTLIFIVMLGVLFIVNKQSKKNRREIK